MSEVILKKEGVVASFPYTFEIVKEADQRVGWVRAYLYDHFQADDQQLESVREQLKQIPVQQQSTYTIEEDKVVYVTSGVVDSDDYYAAEIAIRRAFIEDYIETDTDVHEIVKDFGVKTLKTEFVYD